MRPIYLLLFLLLFGGCSDVIIPDISKDLVELISPPDQASGTFHQYTFSWLGIDGAEAYNLQIVSPRFDSLILIELDTTIAGTNFTYNLPAGIYEWSVVGLNEAYDSDCCEIRTIKVFENESDDLSNQFFELVSPANNACSNALSQMFFWEALPNATHYQFQVAEQNQFWDIINTQFTDSNQANFELPAEGTFFWRVRAENEFTQTFTEWETRAISIDTTAPDMPTLIEPIAMDSIILTDQMPDLVWSSEGVLNDLELYFSSPDNLIYSLSTNAQEIDLDTIPVNLEIGDYYWKLRTQDKAGNFSDDTPLQIFYIKE